MSKTNLVDVNSLISNEVDVNSLIQTDEVKKKENTDSPSSGTESTSKTQLPLFRNDMLDPSLVGVGAKNANPNVEIITGGVQYNSHAYDLKKGNASVKKIELITQVGDEFLTESEVETGVKQPQNEYLRSKTELNQEENAQLESLANQYKDIQSAPDTVQKQTITTPYGTTQEISVDPAKIKKTYLDQIVKAQKDIVEGAKFRDPKYPYRYYDAQNINTDKESYSPVAFNREQLNAKLQEFLDTNLSKRRDITEKGKMADSEFKGKKLADLTEDQYQVLINEFNKKYIPVEAAKDYLAQQGVSFDINKSANAANNLLKGIGGVASGLTKGLDMTKVPEADALNVLYTQAKNHDITKAEYDKFAEYQKKSIEENIKDGQYISFVKLPGIEPTKINYTNVAKFGQTVPDTYVYSETQVRDWLNKMPDYEAIQQGVESPYLYEHGMMGQAADAIDEFSRKYLKTNPLYQESLGLTKIPQLVGTLGAYAAAGAINPLFAGAVGAASMKGDTYIEAIQNGATPENAIKASNMGAVAGSIYALPLSKYAGDLAKAIGVSEGNILAMTAAHGFGGFTQQAGVTLTKNATANALFDQTRKVTEGLEEEGLTNAAIAMLFHVVPATLKKVTEQKEIAKAEGDKEKVAELTQSEETLKAAQELLTTKVTGEKTEVEIMKGKKAEMEAKLPELEKKVETLSKEKGNTGKADLKKAQGELETLKTDLKNTDERIASLESQDNGIIANKEGETVENMPQSQDNVVSNAERQVEADKSDTKSIIKENLNETNAELTGIERGNEEGAGKIETTAQVDKTGSGETEQKINKLIPKPRKSTKAIPDLHRDFTPVSEHDVALQYLSEGGKLRSKDLEIPLNKETGKRQKTELGANLWVLDNESLPIDIIATNLAEKNGLDPIKVEGALRELIYEGSDRIKKRVLDYNGRFEGEYTPEMIKEQEAYDKKALEENVIDEAMLQKYKDIPEDEIIAAHNMAQDIVEGMSEKELNEPLDKNKIYDKATEIERSVSSDTRQEVGGKEESPEKITKDNIPKSSGKFGVVEVRDYTQIEDNKFRPDQQLKFNQGTYEPVRIVAEPDLINLIRQASAEGKTVNGKRKITNLNPDYIKKVEKQYGITRFEALRRVKELAKEHRGNVEKIIILGDELPTKETKVEPTSSEKPPVQESRTELTLEDRIAKKKADIAAKKAERGNLGITEDENKKRAELMADYTDLAILYIQKGLKSAAEFAKELGEDLSDFIHEAWNNAANRRVYEDPEMSKMANAVYDSYIQGKYGVEAVENAIAQLQDTNIKRIFETAKEDIKAGKVNVESVRNRVLKDQHGSEQDQAVLLYDLYELKGREQHVKENMINDPENKEYPKELIKIQNAFQDNLIASRAIGRSASNIFNLRKIIIDKSANLMEMKQSYMAAKKITNLSAEQEAEIQKAYDRMQKLESTIEDLRKQHTEKVEKYKSDIEKEQQAKKDLQDENDILKDLLQHAQEKAKEESKKAKREKRSENTASKIEASKKRIETSKNRLRELRKTAASGVNPEIAVEIGKIAAEKVLIQPGIKFAELLGKVLDEVKDIFPDFTEGDVRDHILHKKEGKTVSEESKIFRKIKDTERLKNKPLEKTKREPPVKSPELEAAERDYAIEHFKWENSLRQEMMKNRPFAAKMVDNILRWQRFSVLSYPSTILKLASLVGHGVVLKPFMMGMHELVYRAMSIPKIFGGKNPMDNASLWGKPQWSAVAKYYSAFLRSFSLENLKRNFKGIDELEARYGKDFIYDEFNSGKGFLEMPGRSHGYIKSFIKRSEFAYAHETMLKNYMEWANEANQKLRSSKLTPEEREFYQKQYDKYDITREDVMEKIGKVAQEHGKWSILMNDSRVVDKLRQFMSQTGLVGAFLKTEMPILKVPVNYVGRYFEIKYGLLTALFGRRQFGGTEKGFTREAPGLINLMVKGTKDLTEEQANILGRSISLGSAGVAFFALGYMLRNKIEENSDGSYEVDGKHVAKLFVHNPFFESVLSGAHTGKVQEERNGEANAANFIGDVVASDIHVVQNSPFVSMFKYGATGKLLETLSYPKENDNTWDKVATITAGKLADIMTPGMIKETAEAADSPDKDFDWQVFLGLKKGNARRPQGNTGEKVVQTLEMGVPGLRERVGAYESKSSKKPPSMPKMPSAPKMPEMPK